MTAKKPASDWTNLIQRGDHASPAAKKPAAKKPAAKKPAAKKPAAKKPAAKKPAAKKPAAKTLTVLPPAPAATPKSYRMPATALRLLDYAASEAAEGGERLTHTAAIIAAVENTYGHLRDIYEDGTR